jgi:hypothetical protein
MQSCNDIARGAPAGWFVCAPAVRTARKKTGTKLKTFMVRRFCGF